MSILRISFDRKYRNGAVRIVNEMGRPLAHLALELGVNKGKLGNWVHQDAAEQAAPTPRNRAGSVKDRAMTEAPRLLRRGGGRHGCRER